MKPVEFAMMFQGVRTLVPDGGAPTPEQWSAILVEHAKVIGSLAAARLLDKVEEEIILRDHRAKEAEAAAQFQAAEDEIRRIRMQHEMMMLSTRNNYKNPADVDPSYYGGVASPAAAPPRFNMIAKASTGK